MIGAKEIAVVAILSAAVLSGCRLPTIRGIDLNPICQSITPLREAIGCEPEIKPQRDPANPASGDFDVSQVSLKLSSYAAQLTEVPLDAGMTLFSNGVPIAHKSIQLSLVGDSIIVANAADTNAWLSMHSSVMDDFSIKFNRIKFATTTGTNVVTMEAVYAGSVLGGNSYALYRDPGAYTPTPGDR